MFGFFKKNTQQKQHQVLNNEKILTEDETKKIKETIQSTFAQLNDTDSNDISLLAAFHEKLGVLFYEINQSDEAISHLEKSLSLKKSIGDGYKKLMTLYNNKRASSAREGDTQAINFWLNKMDEMRNIAKEKTICRN